MAWWQFWQPRERETFDLGGWLRSLWQPRAQEQPAAPAYPEVIPPGISDMLANLQAPSPEEDWLRTQSARDWLTAQAPTAPAAPLAQTWTPEPEMMGPSIAEMIGSLQAPSPEEDWLRTQEPEEPSFGLAELLANLPPLALGPPTPEPGLWATQPVAPTTTIAPLPEGRPEEIEPEEQIGLLDRLRQIIAPMDEMDVLSLMIPPLGTLRQAAPTIVPTALDTALAAAGATGGALGALAQPIGEGVLSVADIIDQALAGGQEPLGLPPLAVGAEEPENEHRLRQTLEALGDVIPQVPGRALGAFGTWPKEIVEPPAGISLSMWDEAMAQLSTMLNPSQANKERLAAAQEANVARRTLPPWEITAMGLREPEKLKALSAELVSQAQERYESAGLPAQLVTGALFDPLTYVGGVPAKVGTRVIGAMRVTRIIGGLEKAGETAAAQAVRIGWDAVKPSLASPFTGEINKTRAFLDAVAHDLTPISKAEGDTIWQATKRRMATFTAKEAEVAKAGQFALGTDATAEERLSRAVGDIIHGRAVTEAATAFRKDPWEWVVSKINLIGKTPGAARAEFGSAANKTIQNVVSTLGGEEMATRGDVRGVADLLWRMWGDPDNAPAVVQPLARSMNNRLVGTAVKEKLGLTGIESVETFLERVGIGMNSPDAVKAGFQMVADDALRAAFPIPKENPLSVIMSIAKEKVFGPVYLETRPAYAVGNIVTNIVTPATEGILAAQNPTQMALFFQQMGVAGEEGRRLALAAAKKELSIGLTAVGATKRLADMETIAQQKYGRAMSDLVAEWQSANPGQKWDLQRRFPEMKEYLTARFGKDPTDRQGLLDFLDAELQRKYNRSANDMELSFRKDMAHAAEYRKKYPELMDYLAVRDAPDFGQLVQATSKGGKGKLTTLRFAEVGFGLAEIPEKGAVGPGLASRLWATATAPGRVARTMEQAQGEAISYVALRDAWMRTAESAPMKVIDDLVAQGRLTTHQRDLLALSAKTAFKDTDVMKGVRLAITKEGVEDAWRPAVAKELDAMRQTEFAHQAEAISADLLDPAKTKDDVLATVNRVADEVNYWRLPTAQQAAVQATVQERVAQALKSVEHGPTAAKPEEAAEIWARIQAAFAAENYRWSPSNIKTIIAEGVRDNEIEEALLRNATAEFGQSLDAQVTAGRMTGAQRMTALHEADNTSANYIARLTNDRMQMEAVHHERLAVGWKNADGTLELPGPKSEAILGMGKDVKDHAWMRYFKQRDPDQFTLYKGNADAKRTYRYQLEAEIDKLNGVPEGVTAKPRAAAAGFTPGAEWQEIPPGTAVPPGGEFRMDMGTGKNYGRWPAPTAQAEGREPWMMSARGYAETVDPRWEMADNPQRTPGYRAQQAHRTLVDEAVRSGKPVPADVLAEYPDLAAAAQAAPPPQAAAPAVAAAPTPPAAPIAAVPATARQIKQMRQWGWLPDDTATMSKDEAAAIIKAKTPRPPDYGLPKRAAAEAETEKAWEALGTPPTLPPYDKNNIVSVPRLHDEIKQDQVDMYRTLMGGLRTAMDTPGVVNLPGHDAADVVNAVEQWARQDVPQWLTTRKQFAFDMAEATRNSNLLDYSDRRNVDSLIAMVVPFHFWQTRTIGNWAARVVEQPEFLATYTRYRQTVEEAKATYPYDYQNYIGLDVPFIGKRFIDPSYLLPWNFMSGIIERGVPRAQAATEAGKAAAMAQRLIGQVAPFYDPLVARLTGTPVEAWQSTSALGSTGGAIKGATALLGMNKSRGVDLEGFLKEGTDPASQALRALVGVKGYYPSEDVTVQQMRTMQETGLAHPLTGFPVTDEDIQEAINTHNALWTKAETIVARSLSLSRAEDENRITEYLLTRAAQGEITEQQARDAINGSHEVNPLWLDAAAAIARDKGATSISRWMTGVPIKGEPLEGTMQMREAQAMLKRADQAADEMGATDAQRRAMKAQVYKQYPLLSTYFAADEPQEVREKKQRQDTYWADVQPIYAQINALTPEIDRLKGSKVQADKDRYGIVLSQRNTLYDSVDTLRERLGLSPLDVAGYDERLLARTQPEVYKAGEAMSAAEQAIYAQYEDKIAGINSSDPDVKRKAGAAMNERDAKLLELRTARLAAGTLAPGEQEDLQKKVAAEQAKQPAKTVWSALQRMPPNRLWQDFTAGEQAAVDAFYDAGGDVAKLTPTMATAIQNVAAKAMRIYEQPSDTDLRKWDMAKEENADLRAAITATFGKGIFDLNDLYWSKPAGPQRQAVVNENPILKEYWDFRDDFRTKHPVYTSYYGKKGGEGTPEAPTIGQVTSGRQVGLGGTAWYPSAAARHPEVPGYLSWTLYPGGTPPSPISQRLSRLWSAPRAKAILGGKAATQKRPKVWLPDDMARSILGADIIDLVEAYYSFPSGYRDIYLTLHPKVGQYLDIVKGKAPARQEAPSWINWSRLRG